MKVRVRVFRRAGREYFEAQWTDPTTGKKKTRTTGKATRKDALRVAARIEAELEDGTFEEFSRIGWEAFIQRYRLEVVPGRAHKTGLKTLGALAKLERCIKPRFVSGVDAEAISRFTASMRKEGLTEATVKSNLSAIRSALRWAKSMGIIEVVPEIKMPVRVNTMKGRPPTVEEFERIRAKVAAIVGADLAAEWLFLVDGLWWSGLRLGEAWELRWDGDTSIAVDLDRKYPMFRIPAGSDKSRKFRFLPMAPEFADHLRTVPESKRRGLVFRARSPVELNRPLVDWASKLISRIGEEAGAKVNAEKFASAHDFRRAFGTRWAKIVMPRVLQKMMRHESIQTTMAYYVESDAEELADEIRAAFANKSANTQVFHDSENAEKR